MEESKKIYVFKSIKSYLPILQVYNSENYQQTNRVDWLKSVFHAVGVTTLLAFIPNEVLLAIWYLFDVGDLSKVIVVTPLLLTIFHMFILFVAMTKENRQILATFDLIEYVVNQRK